MFCLFRNALRFFWSGQVRTFAGLAAVLLGGRAFVYLISLGITQAAPRGIWIVFGVIDLWIVIWQLVGGLRYADRITREDGDMARSWGSYLLLLATVIMFLMGVIGRPPVTNPPPPPVLRGIDGPIDPLPFDGTTATIEGDISYGTFNSLVETLRLHPEVRTVSLHSNGGLVHAGRAIAKQIEIHRLDTHADGLCASACVLAFLAGTHRTLGPDGQLGFHGYFDGSDVLVFNTADQQARDIDYLTTRGIDAVFLERAYGTLPPDLWIPDEDTLRAAGVLTD